MHKKKHRHRWGKWRYEPLIKGWIRQCEAIHCGNCNDVCEEFDIIRYTRPNGARK